MKEKIVPSAPFKNYEDLESLAMQADGAVKRIQIDVCDGKFVPSVSWPFTEYSKSDFEKLGKRDDFDVYLPLWENINYTVDMMVEHPEKYIETFAMYGVDEVIVHFLSLNDTERAFGIVSELCEKYELGLYIAVDVKSDIKKFLDFVQENLDKLKGVQVMGIENIGFQGQEFAPESLEIVSVLKEKFPDLKVLFDGGINEDTIENIRDAGVDVFCVGSYLTQADFFSDSLENLRHILKS
jgi:ribulose-phosphate 3-epimerase